MNGGFRITPILADDAVSLVGWFIPLCVLLVGIVICALVLGVVARLLGRSHGPRALMGMGLLIEVVLGGCLVSWIGMWAWSFVIDPSSFAVHKISDKLLIVAVIATPLILVPFARWLWRWLKESPNDGALR